MLRSTWLVVLLGLVIARNRDSWFPALLAFHVPWKSQKRYAQFCVLPALRLREALPLPESGIAVPATLVSGLGCFRGCCSLSHFLSLSVSPSLFLFLLLFFSNSAWSMALLDTQVLCDFFFQIRRQKTGGQKSGQAWFADVDCQEMPADNSCLHLYPGIVYGFFSGLKHRKWDHDTDR